MQRDTNEPMNQGLKRPPSLRGDILEHTCNDIKEEYKRICGSRHAVSSFDAAEAQRNVVIRAPEGRSDGSRPQAGMGVEHMVQNSSIWDETPNAARLQVIPEWEQQLEQPKTESVQPGGCSNDHDIPLDMAVYAGHDKVAEALQLAGAPTQLYEWQAACLSQPGVLEGRNLIYCAPTSGGKSLVSEILMVRRAFLTRKPAILVLPYVAICAEKAAHYKKIFGHLNMGVVELYGSTHNSMEIAPNTGMIVSTIEKANILVNICLEKIMNRDMLSGIVVDEIHMVACPERGYILELLLTKLKHYTALGNLPSNPKQSVNPLQIVGMSATISNVGDLATWLSATLYITEFRPVPLHQYFVKDGEVLKPDGSRVRTIRYEGHKSQDNVLAALVQEAFEGDYSVIIFCCSRASCERTAKMLAAKRKHLKTPEKAKSGNDSLSDIHLGSKRLETLSGDERRRKDGVSHAREGHDHSGEQRASADKSQSLLSEVINQGIAFHHAGLEREERYLVETGFKI